MNWAIGQHPNIQVMPETAWIATSVIGAFGSYRLGSERGKFSHLSNVAYPESSFLAHTARSIDLIVKEVYESRCETLYGDYRSKGIRINPDNPNAAFQVRRHPDEPKRRWIDGTPLNSHFAWALSRVFPRAKFIHNLRNPADVALSLENFDRVGADKQPLKEGLRTWMQHTESAWLAEKALGPERVFRLDFDRIEREPEAMIRDLLGFLDEDFCAECLEPLKHKTNSSEVENERPGLMKRLRRNRAHRKASEFYDSLVESVSEDARLAAEALLVQRFAAHLANRPLL